MSDNVVRCNNPWCQSTNVSVISEVDRLPDGDEAATPAGNPSSRPVAMRCAQCGKEFVREVPTTFLAQRPAR
ncbi:hypothetical protein [Propionibacterium cyclohexanicum]|uniref:hypothetical protein n=1 Tax=Propionibacterium cyclohexanicum TaxID=64702 RepID=UPI000B81D214|nr:hypothetical protein [Propionibacterium cyclohexanicum]